MKPTPSIPSTPEGLQDCVPVTFLLSDRLASWFWKKPLFMVNERMTKFKARGERAIRG
jgi:hypothetical protein